jgi:hypothetical protein
MKVGDYDTSIRKPNLREQSEEDILLNIEEFNEPINPNYQANLFLHSVGMISGSLHDSIMMGDASFMHAEDILTQQEDPYELEKTLQEEEPDESAHNPYHQPESDEIGVVIDDDDDDDDQEREIEVYIVAEVIPEEALESNSIESFGKKEYDLLKKEEEDDESYYHPPINPHHQVIADDEMNSFASIDEMNKDDNNE